MQEDQLHPRDIVGASLIRGAGNIDVLNPKGTYRCELRDKDGNLKWSEIIHNLVTNVGKNDILDKYLKGSAYTQTLVMGLKGTGTAAAADTQASHAGWNEVGGTNAPAYTGTRPTVTMGAAASQTSTSPTVSFTFTSGGTVAGCFINNGGSTTKDNTTGVLVSAGDFSGGSKTVASGDQLNVTWSLGL